MNLFGRKRIYLDHASTTPINKAVLSAMNEVYQGSYYNPGALYQEGVLASKKIIESRKLVAKLLGATSEHIIFTRGGTESDNLAIVGVVHKFKEQKGNAQIVPHVIVSEIEHSAVFEVVKKLEASKQIDLTVVSVSGEGIVNVSEIKKALRPETVLVSVMYVNNEIGTIQQIREIAKDIRDDKKGSR